MDDLTCKGNWCLKYPNRLNNVLKKCTPCVINGRHCACAAEMRDHTLCNVFCQWLVNSCWLLSMQAAELDYCKEPLMESHQGKQLTGKAPLKGTLISPLSSCNNQKNTMCILLMRIWNSRAKYSGR